MYRYIFYLLPIVLVLAWILPGEIWKWQLARAQVDQIHGQTDVAVDRLSDLVETYPTQPELQFAYFDALAQDGQTESAREFAEVLNEKFPNNRTRLSVMSAGFHQLGEHRLAYDALVRRHADDIKALLQEGDARKWNLGSINSLSYLAYLAKRDRRVWYNQMERALGVTHEVMFAIYRSEALKLVGQPEMAARELIEQLDQLENLQAQKEASWRRDLRLWMSQREWPTEEIPAQLETQRESLTNLRELIGRVGLQGWHVLEGTKNTEYRERFLAAKYNTHAAVAATTDLSPKTVCRELDQYSQYYDTRGCLAMALQQWPDARKDLDRAVLAVELLRSLAEPTGYWESFEMVEIPQIQFNREERINGWAVIYYHRSLVRQHLGQEALRDRDWQQIQQLGYQAGPDLY